MLVFIFICTHNSVKIHMKICFSKYRDRNFCCMTLEKSLSKSFVTLKYYYHLLDTIKSHIKIKQEFICLT